MSMSTIPSYSDPLTWITAYLTVHSLSIPSRRYSFILWIAVVFSFLTFAVLHWTGSRGGQYGAIWSKWALRRRTWRKGHALAVAKRSNQPHRQPVSLPPNAQLLALFVLSFASLALTFIGPDYLAPSFKVWAAQDDAPPHSYDTATFAPYMPQHTISKSLWSSSARTGQIAFALLPLCVLFALKAPPFALFAIPFMIQLYFDKLAWLHRWAGRLVWSLVCVHVVLWSIKLATDVNPSTGRVAYLYAWSYTPFIYGWIAFVLLTLIILLSLHPFRRRFYEWFYILHVLLGPCMLVMAGLHHPTVAYWCWAALAIWFGERVWRGTWWVYANGILGGVTSVPPKDSPWDTWEMGHVHHPSVDSASTHLPMERSPSPLNDYYLRLNGTTSPDHDTPASGIPSRPSGSPSDHFPSCYVPPSGYVHAETLSGRTIRLRIVTPGFLPWSPGQHFLLNIPSISRFSSHPFTCASVCDEQAPTDAGRIMVFLVRVKSGWTRNLWNLVSRLKAEQSKADASTGLPTHGVLLRGYVDGPFGSAKRVRWGNYSTAIIITGGSGVSFGLSLLQYMCMCLAGRDGRHLGGQPGGWGWKGAELNRVRFIWLVREYSHIQWCASIIRWCTSIVPSSALQVDVFVTNFKPIPPKLLPLPAPPRAHFSPRFTKIDEELQPPHPTFAREGFVRHRSRSLESLDSHESQESDVDLSHYLGESPNDQPPPDEMDITHERNILDLTNFDGDVDATLPGEDYFSHRLKKEGKLRRLRTRKLSIAEKANPDTRSLQPSQHAKDSRPGSNPNQHKASPRVPQLRNKLPKLTLSTQSTDRLLPMSPLWERPNSASSETDLISPLSLRPESPHRVYSSWNSVPLSSDALSTVTLVPAGSSKSMTYPPKSLHDVNSESGKAHIATTNVHFSKNSGTLSTSTSGSLDAAPFEMDEQEAMDVNIVSEHARPGKPKLDKVIADEVHASRGAVVVACCGPASLNAMVRKIVASQIDPGRIRRGDLRGSISLVSEEFEY